MSLAPASANGSKLQVAIVDLATRELADEAIERAKAAADVLGRITVTNDAEAERVSDQLALVKDGTKILRAKLDGVLAPLKRAEAAARSVFSPVRDLLEVAERGGKEALQGWLNEKRRQEQAERDRLEREAREAAARQREAAIADAEAKSAETGQHVEPVIPPPMEPPPTPITTRVQGRRSMTYETSTVCCEVVDMHEVVKFDPSLLKLDETRAKQLFRALEPGGAIPVHPLGGYLLSGIRFWRESRVGVK